MRRLLVLAALVALTGLFRPKPYGDYGGSDTSDTVRLNIGSGPAASLTDATVRLRAHLGKVTAKPAAANANPSPPAVDPPRTSLVGTPLTSAEIEAIRSYSSSWYAMMNRYLRDPDSINPADVAEVRTSIDNISLGLSRLPGHEGTTYRGVSTSGMPDGGAQYQPGAVVTEAAFTSTSEKPALAIDFAIDMLMIVEGQNGSSIVDYSRHSGEAEVLYDYGTSFLVQDRYEDPALGLTVIKMQEVVDD